MVALEQDQAVVVLEQDQPSRRRSTGARPDPIASKIRSLHHIRRILRSLQSTGPRHNRTHRNLCTQNGHSRSPRSRLCGSRSRPQHGSRHSRRLRNLLRDPRSRSRLRRRNLRSDPLQALRRP